MGVSLEKRNKLFWLLVAAALVLFLALTGAPAALANPGYFAQIPEGFEQSCNLCHSTPPSLNEFGTSFAMNSASFAGLADPAAEPEPPAGTDPVEKQEAQVALLLPGGPAARGEKMELQAQVTAGGQPVAGKEVKFFEAADLFTQGKMLLGAATTDANGKASINYWPRAIAGEAQLSATVAGDAEITKAETGGSLPVAVAGPLVHQVAELQVPFLNTWNILLLILAVWGAFAYVVVSTLGLRKLGLETAGQEVLEKEEGEEAQRRHA